MKRSRRKNDKVGGPGTDRNGAHSIEAIRERACDALAQYERKKAAVRKEVRREYVRELEHLEAERAQRECVIKEKMIAVERLEEKVRSLTSEIFGLRSKSKLWEHECARISEAYNAMISYYSNPGLIEVQLQVILEFSDALTRFARGHTWDSQTLAMAKRYRDSIHAKLHELIEMIDANPKKDASLNSARQNIDAVHVDGERKF